MISPLPMSTRPAIGFIVEGYGEFYSYRKFVKQITNESLFVPISNAKGCGNITDNLEQHLDDLVKGFHPFSVVITLDLSDQQSKHSSTPDISCADLINNIQTIVDQWMLSRTNYPRMLPLPEEINIIVQIKSFETWLCSDVQGLIQSGYFNCTAADAINDVDNSIHNPYIWLNDRCDKKIHLKNQRTISEIVKYLDSQRMMAKSKSFDKFSRTITQNYQLYLTKI